MEEPFLFHFREPIPMKGLRGRYDEDFCVWVDEVNRITPVPFVYSPASILATETNTRVHKDPTG